MILLEIVDAEQQEPVPPEVLASLRKARQQSQFDPRPLLQPPPVIEVNPVQLDDNEDFFESKADSQRRRRIYRIAKIILSTYVVICVLGGISLLIMVCRSSVHSSRFFKACFEVEIVCLQSSSLTTKTGWHKTSSPAIAFVGFDSITLCRW